MGPIQPNIVINSQMSCVCVLMTPKVIDKRAKLYGFPEWKHVFRHGRMITVP